MDGQKSEGRILHMGLKILCKNKKQQKNWGEKKKKEEKFWLGEWDL